jgi:probable F420-dependent oxidoreductase
MQFWLMGFGLGPRDLVELARDAEDAGFDGLVLSDQLYFPRDFRTAYPNTPSGRVTWTKQTPWPEPYCAIAAMAAVTTQLRFGTYTYIAPLRSALAVAKEVAVAADLCDGRVMLGTSAGWLPQHFEAEGVDFATRGAKLEEMVHALRLLWTGETVEFHGRHVDFEPLSLNPVPPGPVPIYIGGDSDIAMGRAARIGDGWLAKLYSTDEAIARTARLQRLVEEAGRDPADFEIVMALGTTDRHRVDALRNAGVTGLVVSHGSVEVPSGKRPTADQLEELAQAVGVDED